MISYMAVLALTVWLIFGVICITLQYNKVEATWTQFWGSYICLIITLWLLIFMGG